MKFGKLKKRIVIQSYSGTADGRGGYTSGSWAKVTKLWASIDPLRGREELSLKQVMPSVTHKVVTRYQSGLEPSMRVLFGSRIFEIKLIKNLKEEDRMLELICEELPAAAT